MDREKVIKALQNCSIQNDVGCQCCPYFEERKTYGHEWCTTSMAQDALALLKEDCHNCKLECLLQKYDELKEKYDALLKKQEKEPERVMRIIRETIHQAIYETDNGKDFEDFVCELIEHRIYHTNR